MADTGKTQAPAPEGGSSSNSEKSNVKSASVSKAVESFIWEVDALANSLPLVMSLLASAQKETNHKWQAFLKERCTLQPNGRTYDVPPEAHSEFLNVRRKWQRSRKAIQIIPRSFLTALVSHYDSFLGSLIRSLFYMRPELLNTSDRKLSFGELNTFSSIDAAREFVVEKEVETQIRNSHVEQFKWMENKFGIVLTKDLPSWSTFIEVMERRNLFVHCNGIVSTQYLSVCSEEGVDCSKVEVGQELQVSSQYFDQAYTTIVEIGVKLAHVLWRKLKPDEMKTADGNLNNVCLDLIRDEKYTLAQNLLDFAVQYKKFGDESIRRIFVLNRAQAYKWAGDNKKAREILESEDWKASNEKFQLGHAVLKDDFNSAAKLMRRLGTGGGSPSKGDYREWPMFKSFRTTPQFALAYHEVFSEPFVEVTAPTPDKPRLDSEAAKDVIQ
jgi:hypothetical protein